jgi:hypothetical protein
MKSEVKRNMKKKKKKEKKNFPLNTSGAMYNLYEYM